MSVVSKSPGSTPAEQYLNKLCEQTFLSMWSYPNVFRDQGNSHGGDGKELADLLVVFENHILIFSDKDCHYPDSGNDQNDWNRWFRRAVRDSAKQAWGAERWIKSFPDRIYIDPRCAQRFPFDLPEPDQMRFHLVVIGHDGARKCSEQLGGSGSFMIRSDIVGVEHHTIPFTVGDLDPTKTFVHVLDDTSLDILMRARNTISDFVDYLSKKEALFRSGKDFFAAGEEELLAHFLKYLNEEEEHDFVFPPDVTHIGLIEGIWEEFESNPQRKSQLKADEVSYFWDRLIEQFSFHSLSDTQHFSTEGGVRDSERILRLMARENRVRRRMLSRGFLEAIHTAPHNQMMKRYVLPSLPGDPYYVFLLFPENDDLNYEEYRERRRAFLEMHCRVIKFRNPDALDIVGIATEPGINNSGRSEDAIFLDGRQWTDKDQKLTADFMDSLQLSHQQPVPNRLTVKEYPEPRVDSFAGVMKPQKNPRNKPCPCGSKKKYKKCHGAAAR